MNYDSPILEHFYRPRNIGTVFPLHGLGKAGSKEKGIVIEMTISVSDDIISDIKFKTFGCATSIACCSILTELAKGKTLKECSTFTKQTISDALGGIPLEKLFCGELAITALSNAIKDYLYNKGGAFK